VPMNRISRAHGELATLVVFLLGCVVIAAKLVQLMH
jgi:hypothetical protein